MKTEILIISGFLGAGKTTLIQKLLKEAFVGERIALVENDFGEISVDSALLKSGGVEVKEINSGCICCSLSGDFIRGLMELLGSYHPDRIIIEPSGVGKLSEIEAALSDPRLKELAQIKRKITVADVKRCKMYLENFGEFFEDQIKHADTVLLSRTQIYPDKKDDAVRLIKELNSRAVIISAPLDTLRAEDILSPGEDSPVVHARSHTRECGCGKVHTQQAYPPHGQPGHVHTSSCSHGHSAEEEFDTVTIRTTQQFTPEQLKMRVKRMVKDTGGTVLRAKGIVRGANGWLNVQYLPNELRITECQTSGDMLCIIGKQLDKEALRSIFTGG